MSKNKKLIIFSGGGTGGSVSPLLAVYEELSAHNAAYDYAWIGTKAGIEKAMVNKIGIDYHSIAFGKLRRYFSWSNFLAPFKILLGFIQSLFLIYKLKPALIMSAGSYVSVPLIWAAWILRVPVIIHQQDAIPGLANKLMAPFAGKITVALEKSLKDFGPKAVWTGNPVRQSLKVESHMSKVISPIKLNDNLPIVLILGGGTGAMAINELVWKSLDLLTKFCQIIHLTGKSKSDSRKLQAVSHRYYKYEFLDVDGMAEAYNAADIVVSRCGMGVLSEISELGKPAILIPIPGSHQVQNARIFKEKNAAIVLDQNSVSPEIFTEVIEKLLMDKQRKHELSVNIKRVMKQSAASLIAELIHEMLDK